MYISRIPTVGKKKIVNSNVWKSKHPEIQCLEKVNSRIIMFGKTKNDNSNVWKTKNWEQQCLEKKYLEVWQKYSVARRIFNSFLSVSSKDETLRPILGILLEKRQSRIPKFGKAKIKISMFGKAQKDKSIVWKTESRERRIPMFRKATT